MPTKIEIAVIRQVDDCLLVCCCRILNCQRVTSNRKRDNCSEIAWIPLLHVRWLKRKGHWLSACADNIPDPFVKTHTSTVQWVSIVILCELVLFTRKRKFTLLDSVGVPTDSGSDIWELLFAVLLEVVATQCDLIKITFLVLAFDTHNMCTIIGDLDN